MPREAGDHFARGLSLVTFPTRILALSGPATPDSSGSPRTATPNFTSHCEIVSQGSSDVCNSLPPNEIRQVFAASHCGYFVSWYIFGTTTFPSSAQSKPGGTGSRFEAFRQASVTLKPGSTSLYSCSPEDTRVSYVY